MCRYRSLHPTAYQNWMFSEEYSECYKTRIWRKKERARRERERRERERERQRETERDRERDRERNNQVV